MFSTKRSVAALSIASNSTLVTLKLVAGISIGSVSVISEAIHSSIDLLAAIMAFFAVRESAKPPDEQHHFGHGKAESLSGAVEALLIFVAALMIINEAVQKIISGVELENVDLGIAIMGVSAVANIFVSRRLMRVAKATESPALEADAWHLTTDVLTSASVMVGLILVRLTGLSALDPIIAIGVALIITKAAFDITRRTVGDLLDASLPEEEQAVIRDVLDRHSGDMVGYHEIRSRKSGSERHVDLHLVMNRNVTVQESHDLCDHLESDLKRELGPMSLNIHVEPCAPDCQQCDGECGLDLKG